MTDKDLGTATTPKKATHTASTDAAPAAPAPPRALARSVVIDGVSYVAGDVPPPEVAARITNPKAWPAEESAGNTR